MLADNKYSLTGYSSKVLLVRKPYLPLVVYLGKHEYSYWVTMPPTEDKKLAEKFFKWFHNDFVEIVSYIVEKRNIFMESGRGGRPSVAGGKYGWYLPLGVMLELQKMWVEEKVPIMMEILRPTDLIYGRGWTKEHIVKVIEEYLKNNSAHK